ncbi:MAG: Trm112 family protein [Candidatus Thorarchaeota archaeon]
MKLRLLDILACPIDKTWPLKCFSFEEGKNVIEKLPQMDEDTNLICRYYCGKYQKILFDEEKQKTTEEAKKINYDKDCKGCLSNEIISGIIQCPKCENYYPIIEEIPMMLKEELRNEEIERDFTSKWSEKIKELLVK